MYASSASYSPLTRDELAARRALIVTVRRRARRLERRALLELEGARVRRERARSFAARPVPPADVGVLDGDREFEPLDGRPVAARDTTPVGAHP
jgi:hypothetical protein